MGMALPCMRVGCSDSAPRGSPRSGRAPCSYNAARGALLRDSFLAELLRLKRRIRTIEIDRATSAMWSAAIALASLTVASGERVAVPTFAWSGTG
jgi:hypothetical protein